MLAVVTLAVVAIPQPDGAAGAVRCPTTGVPVKAYTSIAGPHVRVHYRRASAADARNAQRVRTEVEGRIWPKFATLLGRRPPTDRRTPGCFNGGDGRLDLWLVPSHKRLPARTTAAFLPYSGEPCEPKKPGAIVLRGTAKRTIVAHEVFHAFQAGFRRAASCISYSEWDEATATWAMDYAYPRELGEVHLGNQRMDFPIEGISGREGWMYIYYLSQRHKPKVVRALHEAQERFREVEAVDAAVPDGAAASFQGYAAAAWNQSPLPDTSVGPSFREWKRVSKPAKPVTEIPLALGTKTHARIPLTGGIRTRATAISRMQIPNDVRWVDLVPNKNSFEPDQRVGAFVNAGGTWTYEDLNGRAHVTWCRDVPGQDVREVVLLVTNAIATSDGAKPLRPDGHLDIARSCPPETIQGTFTGVNVTGLVKLTWNGTITYRYQQSDPIINVPWRDGVHYAAVDGSLSWSASAPPGTGCSVSGSGTLDATGFATPRSAVAKIVYDPTDAPDGWKYEISAGTTPTAEMMVTITCPGMPPTTVTENHASQLRIEGLAVYNGYATGQPVANRYTTDLRKFAGAIINAGGLNTRDWVWDLTGSGGVSPPRS